VITEAWLLSFAPHLSLSPGNADLQELWQGTNFFYYPGANAPNGSVNWPPSSDPQSGVAGATQIGYAALCTPAFTNCSGAVTVAALDESIASFVAFAAGVLADAGIPR
jgi:hypothetical protein